MIEPLGNRVIIEPDSVEEISEGGILMPTNDASWRRAEEAATTTGIVVDFGPSAWLDPALGGEPWCNKGDRVLYAKYSGKDVIDPEDKKKYVVINDDAIQARIEK